MALPVIRNTTFYSKLSCTVASIVGTCYRDTLESVIKKATKKRFAVRIDPYKVDKG